MMVPFLDMKARTAPLREEYMQAIGEIIDSGAFSGGPFVERFENEFAAYCGTRHAIGVGSGTEALWLTLLALGIGPGDEVITVPLTFAATVEAICLAGATPVFADIDARTYTINPAALESVRTRNTKAIIPVHLFGQPADMDPILEFARKHCLRVIEDAAQAHGAEYKGRKAGLIGDAGCFSFYPGKNLGAFGEAGAVVTGNDELANQIRMLGNHGQSRKNVHSLVGWNSRMDGIQAAVLRIRLRHLEMENRLRRDHALRYNRALADLPGLVLPAVMNDRNHVFHLYALRARDRGRLIDTLGAKEIGCGLHYPVPVHLQPAYRHLGYRRGDFPVAEQSADELVSLPMFPEMTQDQIAFVTAAVTESVTCSLAAGIA
jgi:dTDP-4-amino-4,6-dideoxygalactose transaminase